MFSLPYVECPIHCSSTSEVLGGNYKALAMFLLIDRLASMHCAKLCEESTFVLILKNCR